MDPVELPDAQEQQAVAETPDQNIANDQTEKAEFQAGIQRRIDELTARFHDTRRELDEEKAAKAVLLQQMTMLQQRPVAQEPPVEVDPELRRGIDSVYGPTLQRLEAQNRDLQVRLASQEARNVAIQQGEAPEVVDLAQKLMIDWHRRGVPGVTAEDAVVHATGLLARQERARTAAAKTERTGFNKLSTTNLATQSAPPRAVVRNEIPKDLDDRSPEEQAKFWADRVGDSPL